MTNRFLVCTQTLNTELDHSVLNHQKMSPFKIDIFLLKIIVAFQFHYEIQKKAKKVAFSLFLLEKPNQLIYVFASFV